MISRCRNDKFDKLARCILVFPYFQVSFHYNLPYPPVPHQSHNHTSIHVAGNLERLTGHLEVRIGGTVGRAHVTDTALQIGRHTRVAVRGDNVGLLTQGVIT